ncbi:hypothetical protein Vretifemale_7519, partial [Volvox reticuliferus]
LRSRIPSPPPRPPPPSPSSRPRSLPSPPPPRPPSPSPPLRQPFPSLRPPSPSPPLRLLPPSQSPPRLLPPSPPPPRLLNMSPPPPRQSPRSPLPPPPSPSSSPTTRTAPSPLPSLRPPPPSTKVGGCMDPDAALDLHNQYRAYHSTPALAWDNTLATHAQAWAETLAAGGCGLKHEGLPDEGENLFAASSFDTVDLNCTWAVEAWYDEVSEYSFTSTPYRDNRGKGIGHFTQVVWVDTTNVGCGAAESTTSSGNACYVVSCRYAPPGNYVGDGSYYDNVRRPKVA